MRVTAATRDDFWFKKITSFYIKKTHDMRRHLFINKRQLYPMNIQ